MGIESRSEREWPFHSDAYPSTLPQRVAPHIGHQQHLCAMCESGGCSLDQIKELVKHSKFICKTCGRTAVYEANLCEPVPL